MNLKTVLLPFILTTFILPELLAYDEDRLPDLTASCYNETETIYNNPEIIENFKTTIENIAQDLKDMTPEKIVQFCNKLDTPGNPLDCAAIYYSKQYEQFSDILRALADGSHSDCDILFSSINKTLKSDETQCYNDTSDDQARLNSLIELHSGLLGSIIVLQRVFDGATLQDLFNEAIALKESEAITEEESPQTANDTTPNDEMYASDEETLLSTEDHTEQLIDLTS